MPHPRTYTLSNNQGRRYTFTRQGRTGMLITTWAAETWLARHLADATEALACWRHLRRQGYRPAPRASRRPDAHGMSELLHPPGQPPAVHGLCLLPGRDPAHRASLSPLGRTSMPTKPIWSTYECPTCHTQHEMRGSPAQLTRQGATRCPDCAQEMRFVSAAKESPPCTP